MNLLLSSVETFYTQVFGFSQIYHNQMLVFNVPKQDSMHRFFNVE